ncbi:MAG: ankyrin repeat domain-containing protein, partial [Aestuariivirgaceae bacterium]
YMWGGQYKFTVLTGVFGQGEGGPISLPEHPDCVTFARALLDAGADPNDSQAAYNRLFEPDDTCLELLIEYGLSAKDKNNWFEQDANGFLPNPEETMHYQLIMAIHWGNFARARLLIDNGVDIAKPDDTYETMTKGRAPYEVALLMGETRTAEYLLANGTTPAELPQIDRFHVACMAGDLQTARQMLSDAPNLIDDIDVRRGEMLNGAAQTGNWPALETMMKLGFDVSKPGERTPLHQAALQGRLDLVKQLVAAGADTRLRDPDFHAPPLGFALHAKKHDVVAFLETVEMDIFTAAARGIADQLQARLQEDPARLNQRFSDVRTGTHNQFGTDWFTPLVSAATNNRVEAVRWLLEQGADPNISDGGDKTLLSFARDHADDDIVAMIEGALAR